MSIEYRDGGNIALRCDGCHSMLRDGRKPAEFVRISHLYALAHDRDWRIRIGGDLCPACQKRRAGDD